MMSESYFERKKSKMLVFLSTSYRPGRIWFPRALLGEKFLFLSLPHTEALLQQTLLHYVSTVWQDSSFTWENKAIQTERVLKSEKGEKGKKSLF